MRRLLTALLAALLVAGLLPAHRLRRRPDAGRHVGHDRRGHGGRHRAHGDRRLGRRRDRVHAVRSRARGPGLRRVDRLRPADRARVLRGVHVHARRGLQRVRQLHVHGDVRRQPVGRRRPSRSRSTRSTTSHRSPRASTSSTRQRRRDDSGPGAATIITDGGGESDDLAFRAGAGECRPRSPMRRRSATLDRRPHVHAERRARDRPPVAGRRLRDDGTPPETSAAQTFTITILDGPAADPQTHQRRPKTPRTTRSRSPAATRRMTRLTFDVSRRSRHTARSAGPLTRRIRPVTPSTSRLRRHRLADPQLVTVAEDSSDNPITLTGSDPEDDALTFDVATQPAHGTLSGTEPDLTYTPNANFFGTDTFTYTATDGTETSPAATVTITVTSGDNDPVLAKNDAAGRQGDGHDRAQPAGQRLRRRGRDARRRDDHRGHQADQGIGDDHPRRHARDLRPGRVHDRRRRVLVHDQRRLVDRARRASR